MSTKQIKHTFSYIFKNMYICNQCTMYQEACSENVILWGNGLLVNK